jgi:cytochrome o ubiquinol oxidase subunit 1
VVDSLDGFWEHKKKGLNIENRPASEKRPYEDIHMPRNTGVAFVIGAFALAFGFAMIWHIWWLAVVGLVGIIASVITRGFNYDIDYFVKAKEVEETESEIENMKKVGA